MPGLVQAGSVGAVKRLGGLQSQVGTFGWGRAQLAGRETRSGGQGWGPRGCPQLHWWLGAAPAWQGWGVRGAARSVFAPSPQPAPSLPWWRGSPKPSAGAKGPKAAPDPVAESSFGALGAGSAKRGRCHRSELAADAVAAQKSPVPGEQVLPLAAGCGRLAKGFKVTPSKGESRRRGAEQGAGPGWDLQGGAAPRRAFFGRKQLISAEPGWSPASGRCVRGWDGLGSCFLAQTSPSLLTLSTPAVCRAVCVLTSWVAGGHPCPGAWHLLGAVTETGSLAPLGAKQTPQDGARSLDMGSLLQGGQRGFWNTPCISPRS